ncbi:unnamed protein product [Didymodactylos carnosus]|uniref:Ribosomal protein L18 n=1 Tax=Didymodactylos carnosus TaxID=1234261 RepID=A0A814VMD3_9BILA|nr:unnamed protein product [Didymodactylos carnosus]CAF1203369.1 unnamed protein product [Didymodactylos carnosus]CAF3954333.1 unnamed protein product [Didymodactylos carnosus]CAF4013064.1 unnamed protein product [Didymodactylos carnosus]
MNLYRPTNSSILSFVRLCFQRYLSTDVAIANKRPETSFTKSENENYKVSSLILNRNPRTLEWQNLQYRTTGWPLQYPPKDYIHKALLERTGRHLISRIEHTSGVTCLTVTTREYAIRKHLGTTQDRTSAYWLGVILGQRALECGITRIYFHHSGNRRYEKSERLKKFYIGLCDSGIEFEDNKKQFQLTKDDIDGVNYDEQFKDVRYQPPQIQFPPDLYHEKLHYLQLGLQNKIKKGVES